MIVLVHDFHKVLKIEGIHENEYKIVTQELSIAITIYSLASYYPNEIIVWCHKSVYSKLNRAFIENAFLHNRYMYSYNPMGNFFSDAIGYIEESPFININKQVCYPTWQMSSVVGAMKSSTILLIDKTYWTTSTNLDFVLNSIAKLYQPLGMFCYSEPQLITASKSQITYPVATTKELFSFVSQHYKWVWKHFLLLCYVIFENRLPLLPWLFSIFKTQQKVNQEELNFENYQSVINWENETIDVIIPTIGRKQYLYDVLKDLSGQTHLPKNVVIVEQNPIQDSESELDYIHNEVWPFKIKHIFTHQTGACQARNKALDLLESKWCFFNDDDNRFDENLIKEALKFLIDYHLSVFSTNYLLKDETQLYNSISQTTIFGSGNSFIKSEITKTIGFELKLEFGYGEDTEYGLKLRNNGFDIIYNPIIKIIHLKAPMGGFRTKFIHPWEKEPIQPKPSPTIMYVKEKYSTKEQMLGYKMRLFLKTYQYKFWKVKGFEKQWKQSKYWSAKL
jgi:GT2 family glycosyltransferase